MFVSLVCFCVCVLLCVCDASASLCCICLHECETNIVCELECVYVSVYL